MEKKDLMFIGLAGINLLLWISILFISRFYTNDPIQANVLVQLFPAFVMAVAAWLIVKGGELPLALLNVLKGSLVIAFVGMLVLLIKFVRTGS